MPWIKATAVSAEWLWQAFRFISLCSLVTHLSKSIIVVVLVFHGTKLYPYYNYQDSKYLQRKILKKRNSITSHPNQPISYLHTMEAVARQIHKDIKMVSSYHFTNHQQLTNYLTQTNCSLVPFMTMLLFSPRLFQSITIPKKNVDSMISRTSVSHKEIYWKPLKYAASRGHVMCKSKNHIQVI